MFYAAEMPTSSVMIFIDSYVGLGYELQDFPPRAKQMLTFLPA